MSSVVIVLLFGVWLCRFDPEYDPERDGFMAVGMYAFAILVAVAWDISHVFL